MRIFPMLFAFSLSGCLLGWEGYEEPSETDTAADCGEDLDTEVTDDVVDTVNDTAASEVALNAVLEGAMSSSGIQYAAPSNLVEMGYWTFGIESLDDDDHTVTIVPTGFTFTLDADNDNRFGLPTDDDMVAGDVIHFCRFYTAEPSGIVVPVEPSDIGGPELNTMSSDAYPTFSVETEDVIIGLWCTTFDDIPTGTKIAVSMQYEVTTSENVFDASTARTDNTGTLPQYYVRFD